MSDREANLLKSVTETTWRFYLWVGALSLVVLWGLLAYTHQFRQGLIVTGMRDHVSWGLYITNFVFFIGISHAGTLISAILRVTDAGWRRPITRMAEGITVFALCIGAPMVVADLGRPERMFNLILHGRIQSPILWDILSVCTYLTGCVLYFYLPLIPDLGLLAKHNVFSAWRRRLYRLLSLGWTGSAEEVRLLDKAISIMAVMIIPLAVSVHTVVSWIFAMTLRPGWNSSIFGPYFVVGAIFSGTASVILSMYVLRRVFRLENYLQPMHFRNLGLLLLTFALLYAYFNVNEYLTVGYKFQGMEKHLVERLLWGDYAFSFWSVQGIGVGIPLLLMMAVLGIGRYKHLVMPGVALASLLVIAGAWAKRYLIVVPTMGTPYLPIQGVPGEWAHYQPTWVEWSITAAGFAGFLLIYSLLAKLFPIVSIWETREDEAERTSPVAETGAQPYPAWRTAFPTAGVLLAILVFPSTTAVAAGKSATKRATVTKLSVEWRPVPVTTAQQASRQDPGSSAALPPPTSLLASPVLGPLFSGGHIPIEEEPTPAIDVTATLQDQAGLAVSFQIVRFSLKTTFGTLDFGNRPTDGSGKARLVIQDRRYGQYPLRVAFPGNDAQEASVSEVLVDFGSRPSPTLPKVGVLIDPGPSASIALPFLIFYGAMWAVFIYAFGYLVLWRMHRSRRSLTTWEEAPPEISARQLS